MDWTNERWVKLYTRDTADWLAISWQAQGLFCLILRKVDRAGRMDLGRHGARGLAAHCGGASSWPSIEPVLEELLRDGWVALEGSALTIPNFVASQEAVASSAQRKRNERERVAVTKRDEAVTNRDEESHVVTPSHAASRTEQNRTEETRGEEKRGDCPKSPDGDSDRAANGSAMAAASVAAKPPRKPRRAPAEQKALSLLGEPSPPPAKPRRAFAPVDACNAIARTSNGRFATVTERNIAGGHAIAIGAQIDRFPTIEEWGAVGEWLAAGGERMRSQFGPSWAASAKLQEAMGEAASWVERGRPALVDAKGFPVVAVTPVEPAEPDPWALAEAKYFANGGA